MHRSSKQEGEGRVGSPPPSLPPLPMSLKGRAGS